METQTNQKILSLLLEHEDDMAALLTRLVELESPTNEKRAVDRLGAFLAGELKALGADVDVLPQSEAGDHVRGHWGDDERGALLLCHMDTVWDHGQTWQWTQRLATLQELASGT